MNNPLSWVDPLGFAGSSATPCLLNTPGCTPAPPGSGDSPCYAHDQSFAFINGWLVCGAPVWIQQILSQLEGSIEGSSSSSGGASATNNGTQKPQPKSPARQQCEANAAEKYQNTFAAFDKGFYPKAGKSALKGAIWTGLAGCAVTLEIGCGEGGLPGYVIGGLAGAGKSMWEDLGSVGMAYLQYRDEMNACKSIP